MSWAKPTDVTGAWIGNDAPADIVKVQTWIDKAEREIRSKVADIQARIDAEAAETPPRKDLLETAVDVVVEMVTRVFINPTRQRSVSESIGTGPLSEAKSVTFGGDNPGKLYLAPDELEKLRPPQQDGAFEINLLPSNYRGPNAWPW